MNTPNSSPTNPPSDASPTADCVPVIPVSTHPLSHEIVSAHDVLLNDLIVSEAPPAPVKYISQSRARQRSAELLNAYESDIMCRRIKNAQHYAASDLRGRSKADCGYFGIYQRNAADPSKFDLKGFGRDLADAFNTILVDHFRKTQYMRLSALRERLLRIPPAEAYDICQHILSLPVGTVDLGVQWLCDLVAKGEDMPEFDKDPLNK